TEAPPVAPPGRPPTPRPPLPFGHSPPPAEADPVVQRFGKPFGTHRPPHADQLGPVLPRPSNEQAIRIGVTARGVHAPIRLRVTHKPPAPSLVTVLTLHPRHSPVPT